MRASSFGQCIKASVAERLGLTPQEPPAVLAAAFERGDVHEEECAAALRADGWDIGFEQQEVECEGIVGHIDGAIGREDTHTRVWETKAPSAWAAYERAHKTGKDTPLTLRYKWQSSLYMHALGLEQMVSCLEDGRVKSFVIEVPPFSLEEIRLRRKAIEAWEQLPPECEEGCFDAWSCPYRYLHDKPAVVENAEIDRLAEMYDEYRMAEKLGKEGMARAKAELEKLMVFDDRIETQTSIVTKYEAASPARYDMEAIRIALDDQNIPLDSYLLPEKKSPRMKITRKVVDRVNESGLNSEDTTEGES
jgi:hypothetical protein